MDYYGAYQAQSDYDRKDLRDRFAAAALVGLLASATAPGSRLADPKHYTLTAYDYADAMMNARHGSPKPDPTPPVAGDTFVTGPPEHRHDLGEPVA